MAEESLLQGSPLPSTTTTTQAVTVAPEFYTNYLQDIANLGKNAVEQGGVAELSPLQKQAFDMAPQTAFAGAGTLGQAVDVASQGVNLTGQGADVLNRSTNMLERAGNTTAPSVIDQYMNPYTKNVVDEMTRQNQLNVQRNILPALRAMGVSTGGLGSTRMANVSGQTLADIQAALTGQQYNALNTGYKDAMTAAQEDLRRQYQAGTGLTSAGTAYGNLGQDMASLASNLTTAGRTQSDIANTGLKTLSDLGSLEQAYGQKLLDYPMAQVEKFSKLLQNYNIPMGETKQTVQPGQQGQFSNAPLAQIAGLLQALGAFGQGFGGASDSITSLFGDLTNEIKKYLPTLGTDSNTGQKNGGYIRKADGGAIRGGLQSMIQGANPNQNSNIPTNGNPMNANIPNVGSNPPALNVQSLNYQNDPNAFNLNESTMTGTVPNSDLMVG